MLICRHEARLIKRFPVSWGSQEEREEGERASVRQIRSTSGGRERAVGWPRERMKLRRREMARSSVPAGGGWSHVPIVGRSFSRLVMEEVDVEELEESGFTDPVEFDDMAKMSFA